jgi:hypothetical protein
MYLAHGKVAGAIELLRRSALLLDACADAAAPHVRAWRTALDN